IAVLDDYWRGQREAPHRSLSGGDGSGARNDDGPWGNHDRLVRRRSDDLAPDEIVDRRRASQNGSGGNDGAALHDGALVNPRVAPDERIVLDDDGKRADRFDDAANLRAGADVDARPDLSARPHEGVRIDQRLLTHPGADVDEHRRHADDARTEVGAVAHGRSSRHEADAG